MAAIMPQRSPVGPDFGGYEWRCAPDWGTLSLKTIALTAPLSRLRTKKNFTQHKHDLGANTVLGGVAYAKVAIVDRVV